MDDEISLAELWNTLVRRWRAIAITTIIFTVAAGTYAYLKPLNYSYNTALEVGTYPVQTENGPDRRIIEPSKNVEHKLRLAYIPLARSEIGDNSPAPIVTLKKKSGSRLFILSSLGNTSSRFDISKLHQRILDLLIEDNNKILNKLIEQQQSKIRTHQAELAHISQKSVQQSNLKTLQEQYQKAKQKLPTLDQQHAVTLAILDAEQQTIKSDLLDNKATRDQLNASIKRIDEHEQLLHDQITTIKHRLMQLRQTRDAAVAESSKNANAVAVLMVGSEVSQTERQLWELRNLLTIDLPAGSEELTRKLTENRGNETKLHSRLAELRERRASTIKSLPGKKLIAIAEVERLSNDITKGEQVNLLDISQANETIQRLKSELTDMTPTAPLYVAIRAIDPQGPGKVTLLAIGIMLGVMLGTLSALISEHTNEDRVKNR